MASRRQFLLAGTAIGAAGLYSYNRGLRYPRLSFEHQAPAQSLNAQLASFVFKDAIAIPRKSDRISFRAIAPEPSIKVHTLGGQHQLSINNVAKNAKLSTKAAGVKLIEEEIEGTKRLVRIDSTTEQEIVLSWFLPSNDGFDFAVMGDTGGGSELEWTLKRSAELGAQFLLHLGDFNYGGSEYEDAIQQFSDAPLPCYVSIGNHDFHDNGLIYQRFLQQLGPMNHAFDLAGTRFVNIDTAADFFPAHSGERGKLFKQLQSNNFGENQIFFTHRPIKDPRPHDDHEIGGINEIDWLSKSIRQLGGNKLLTGHVHHSAELEFEGIKQFTVGEGLGHENLVLQKQVAKIMLARVQPGLAMQSKWVNLNMPWASHQSPTHEKKLRRDGRTKQLDWYLAQIKEP